MPYDQDQIALEYHQAKSVREAVAREIARRIEITPELASAKRRADDAVADYREAVRQAVKNLRF